MQKIQTKCRIRSTFANKFINIRNVTALLRKYVFKIRKYTVFEIIDLIVRIYYKTTQKIEKRTPRHFLPFRWIGSGQTFYLGIMHVGPLDRRLRSCRHQAALAIASVPGCTMPGHLSTRHEVVPVSGGPRIFVRHFFMFPTHRKAVSNRRACVRRVLRPVCMVPLWRDHASRSVHRSCCGMLLFVDVRKPENCRKLK